MKKIISLLAALMIFAFSFLGEDVHASSSSCADSITVQSAPLAKCGTVKAASTKLHKDASSDPDSSIHDCHFGHCAFTVRLPSKIHSPLPLVGTDVVRHHSLIHSGYRSETLRPPSRL